MKILVTGGTGYIGSHTVVELVKAGYEPVIIDSLERSDKKMLDGIENIIGKKVTFYQGDTNNPADLNKVFEKEKPFGGVIHFAAYKAVGESVAEPLMYYRNNVGSMVALIEAMIRHNVSNLVFSSSCTVYGQPEDLPVTEDSPVLPAQSPYGNTKQICEEILVDTVAAEKPIKGLSLRYFNPVGAHPSAEIGELPLGTPNNLVPFITQCAAGIRKELKIFGKDYANTPDGTCVRDYIHVVDLAKAHVKAVEYLNKQQADCHYNYVNVGTGKGNSVLEVVNTFEEVTGEKLNYSFTDRRPGDVEQVYANVDKSKQMLGWQAELSVADSMKDAWQWEKKIRNL